MSTIGHCLLQIKDLEFSFPQSTTGPLFQHLNLEMRAGEVFGLIGPGGSGKSTLLKLIAGLLTPSRGELFFEGGTLEAQWEELKGVEQTPLGMSFQKSGLFDSFSCGDNLRFPLREATRLPKAAIEEKVKQALAEVGLSGIESLRVHQISGGMQKRLGIARALILRPKLILYDDPTAGLDPITSRSIGDLILSMKAKYAMTVIVVSSDVVQASRLSDRLGFLHGGKFLDIQPPAVLSQSKNASVHQFMHGTLDGPLSAEGME